MCSLHLEPYFGVTSLTEGLNGVSARVRSLTKLSDTYWVILFLFIYKAHQDITHSGSSLIFF